MADNQREFETEQQINRLVDCLPAPRGLKLTDEVLKEYHRAMAPFTIAEITEAVDRRLSGGFPDIRTTAYPRVPEFADLCKRVRAEHAKVEHERQRAVQIAKEREEFGTVRKKTPEELERAKALMDDFRASRARLGLEGKAAQVAQEMREMAERRLRYGMTQEKLDRIPDRILPAGMEPIGEASERALPPAPPGTEAWNEPVEVSEALKRKMGFSPPPPHPDDYGERSR